MIILIYLKLTYDFIKEALNHDKVPAQIQLRYRIQGKNETPSEFGEAIRTLGNNAYGNGCEQNQTVIESFCIGLKSTELSAKMLQSLSLHLRKQLITLINETKISSSINSLQSIGLMQLLLMMLKSSLLKSVNLTSNISNPVLTQIDNIDHIVTIDLPNSTCQKPLNT